MNFKLIFIAMIFSFNVVKDTSALHLTLRSYLQENKLCTFNSGNRTWNHRCKSRRDSVIDRSHLASRERGPSRDAKGYNPVYGYEPYWEFGDWVFDKIRAKEGEIRVCGFKCPDQYISFGHICAANKEMTMKSYENYCELRDQDCEDIEGWTVAYRGPCLGVPQPMPTDPNELVAHANKYINEINKIAG